MLKIHVLNVQHGDSIILEHEVDGVRSFGVIDCNTFDNRHPALEKLTALGAERLSFVCLTHPHGDHYKGMLRLLEAYLGRVDYFYSYPVANALQNKGALQKLTTKLLKMNEGNDNAELLSGLMEFIKILRFVDTNFNKEFVAELYGGETRVYPTGFAGVGFWAIQPPPSRKGPYTQKIENNQLEDFSSVNDNHLSLALKLNYQGRQIILGGDATRENWAYHKRQYQKLTGIQSDMVKLPHHGSKADCDADTLMTLFKPNAGACGIISSNGRSHPDSEVLEWLETNEIKTYCTNLAKKWSKSPVVGFTNTTGLNADLKNVIHTNRTETEKCRQTCRGDICYCVDGSGVVSIDTQFNPVCGCHPGVLADLIAS